MRFTKVSGRLLGAAAAVGLSGLCGSTTEAARVFDFVTNQPTYTVAPGGSVSVQVFLRETLVVTGSEDTSLLQPEDGLSAGAALVQQFGALPTDPAVITAAVRNTTNFDFLTSDSVAPGGAEATVGGVRGFENQTDGDPEFDGTGVIVVNSSDRRVSIGTLTIQAGDLPGQTTTFQTGDPDDDDTATWENLIPLDGDITPYNFAITTTPEPAGFAVIAVGGMMLLGRRRRQQAN